MADVQRITLSLRQQDVGGEVNTDPAVSDASLLNSAQHLVLLIHGYNNNLQDAVDAYNGFHARQKDLDSAARYGLGRTFVEVYWPGDADWGVASFLYYMGSIAHAKESAAALAHFLLNRVGGARIDIVAHSMGCRVAFELLYALDTQQASLNIGRIVCMAGAVPTFMLVDAQPPRRLRPAYDRVLREGARSLYSGADMVLAAAFPAGQSLAAGEEGATPSALGHAFWVDASVPFNLGQVENPGAGHSDYWGWNTKPQPLQCAQHAAREVRGYLQFPSAGSRALSARTLVEARAIEARELAQQREIEERETARYSS
jgi:pimeloyl-ACP methyl ester carboxylesterase